MFFILFIFIFIFFCYSYLKFHFHIFRNCILIIVVVINVWFPSGLLGTFFREVLIKKKLLIKEIRGRYVKIRFDFQFCYVYATVCYVWVQTNIAKFCCFSLFFRVISIGDLVRWNILVTRIISELIWLAWRCFAILCTFLRPF